MIFGSTRSMALDCQYVQSIKANSQTTAGAPVLGLGLGLNKYFQLTLYKSFHLIVKPFLLY